MDSHSGSGVIRSDPEWSEVIRSDPEWFGVIRGDPEWSGVIRSDPEWFGVIRSDTKWSGVIRSDPESNPVMIRSRSHILRTGVGVDPWLRSGLPITSFNHECWWRIFIEYQQSVSNYHGYDHCFRWWASPDARDILQHCSELNFTGSEYQKFLIQMTRNRFHLSQTKSTTILFIFFLFFRQLPVQI